jgi:hypothetical protein
MLDIFKENPSGLIGKDITGNSIRITSANAYRLDIALTDIPNQEIKTILDSVIAKYSGKVEINFITDLK